MLIYVPPVLYLLSSLSKISRVVFIVGDVSNRRETNLKVKSELVAGSEPALVSVTRERWNRVNENDFASSSGNKREVFHGSKKTESLSSKSGKEEIIEEGNASVSQYNPDKWMIPDKVDAGLSQLNLAIVSF